MVGKRGAVVAIEPSTGEILCLVSSPTYDPRLLVGRQRGENYRKLVNDEAWPLRPCIYGRLSSGLDIQTHPGTHIAAGRHYQSIHHFPMLSRLHQRWPQSGVSCPWLSIAAKAGVADIVQCIFLLGVQVDDRPPQQVRQFGECL